MPDPGAGGSAEVVRLWSQVLTVVGLVSGAGAVAAYATGDEFYARGAMTRTQLDAVWVLGVMAVALMAAAFVLVLRTSALESRTDHRRSDAGY